jgi:hypothetical protein
MELTDEQYKKEYDEAWKKMDEEAAQATPSRGPDGKFTKPEEVALAAEPAKAEPVAETPPAEAKPEAKPDDVPPNQAEAEPASDPNAELRSEMEKFKKQAADNKAWATKVAMELAEAKREREQREREAAKPQVLEQNPGLEEAIRYVADAPKPQAPDPRQEWIQIVDAAHPGIFSADADPELVDALVAKRDASNGAWQANPLLAIREITETKLAHAQQQAEKRFAAEQQKASAKSAMSVPGAGATVKTAADPAADEVKRIQSMTPAQFEQERRRVLGY